MEETYLLKHPGVKKKILSGGQGPLPHFPNGTKLVFHFQTLLDNFERTVIDDSRTNKRPTEIFVGKMFKMEVWEVLLTSMRIGEVAEFWCDAIHTGLYPIVSKGMRLAAQGKDPLEGQKHMCGMGNVFTYHSTGFPELDELMREPQPLIFIMELISVGDPLSYHRESWLMDKDEKMQMVPTLHLQGNNLVRQKCYGEASEKYKEAVLLLRVVQSREMPGGEDYINLGKLIIPLVLNYCQCMLELEEYYEVIEHATELIAKHKDCVKAYYKRAKAYAAVWSEKEAKKDFLMVANLDATLARLVQRELTLLSERMKEKYWEDKERYWNMLEEKEKKKEEKEIENGKGGEEKEEEQNAEELEMKKNSSIELQCPQEEEKNAQESQKEPDSEAKERIAALINGKDRQQMLRLIMLLQDEGIFHIKVQRYVEAIAKFSEALVYVDHIQSNEVEYKGEDWESLEKVRVPLTLNLSQCKFELGEYEEVVELNNKLLKTHRDNLKAVYQRARAHSALYNEEEARRDFSILVRLDPNFKPIVQQELKKLGEKLRTKHVHEKKNYWSSSQDKWEKKAQTKRNGKTEKKKEVKWADESETIRESLTEVKDDPASFDQGKEGTLNPAGNKEGQTEKKESTDTKQEDCPGLKEGKAEADNKPEDKGRDLAQAEVHKVNLDSTHRSDTDSEVREISLTPAQEEAVKSTAGTDRTGLLKSSDVQEESINSAGAGEQGYSGEPGAEKAEKLAQQSNRLRSAENKKGKAVSSQGKQGKNAKVKTGPKEVSTPSSTASKAPSAKPTSKTTKGKPNKI